MKPCIQWRRKILIVSLLFILTMGASSPVSSLVEVKIVYREEFVNTELSSWILESEDWCWFGEEGNETIKGVEHSYVVQNGYLYSDLGPMSERSCQPFNLAWTTNPIRYGNYSFDYKKTEKDMQVQWEFILTDYYSVIGKTEEEFNATSIKFHDFGTLEITHTVDQSSPNNIPGRDVPQSRRIGIPYTSYQWYHIEIVRIKGSYSLYVDDTFVLSLTVPEEWEYDYNYAGLISFQSSLMSYDNFTISRVVNESNKGGSNWELIVFGTTFGLITIVYSWSKGKKNF